MKIIWFYIVFLIFPTNNAYNEKYQNQVSMSTVKNFNESFLAEEYLKQFFAPLRLANEKNKLVLVLDQQSFIRKMQFFEKEIKPLVFTKDIKKEISQANDDLFAFMYEQEDILDNEVIVAKRKLCSAKIPQIEVERLEFVNKNVFTYPRHYESEVKIRKAIGDYISRRFALLGLITGFQQFNPSQFLYLYGNQFSPVGGNLIGIYPGTNWGTSSDKLIIVGAHWDTFNNTDGFNDNGSGVTAMLEIARVLTQRKCQLKYSVAFVAFDLEEVGIQGSLEFIHRFLFSNIFQSFGHKDILGAFILDTILNYNDTQNSQETDDTLKEILPETYKAIADGGFRGNYVEVIQREKLDDDLSKTFIKHWKKGDSKYRLINSRLNIKSNSSTSEMVKNINYLRSDHSRFWFTNNIKYPSLKAILITDSGPKRGLMKECYHKNCDSIRNGHGLKFANFKFLKKVSDTILGSIIELSEAQCKVKNNNCQSHPTKYSNANKFTTYNGLFFFVCILNIFLTNCAFK